MIWEKEEEERRRCFISIRTNILVALVARLVSWPCISLVWVKLTEENSKSSTLIIVICFIGGVWEGVRVSEARRKFKLSAIWFRSWLVDTDDKFWLNHFETLLYCRLVGFVVFCSTETCAGPDEMETFRWLAGLHFVRRARNEFEWQWPSIKSTWPRAPFLLEYSNQGKSSFLATGNRVESRRRILKRSFLACVFPRITSWSWWFYWFMDWNELEWRDDHIPQRGFFCSNILSWRSSWDPRT